MFNSPQVLRERATLAELRQSLMGRDVGRDRSKLVDQLFNFTKLDDQISIEMVQEIPPFGNDFTCWPWEREKVFASHRGRFPIA